MHYVVQIFELFSKWMREGDGLFGISMAIVATLLIVFGNDINGGIRKWIKNYPFPARLIVFVLVCAVGYGMMAILLAQGLTAVLSQMNNAALSPVVIMIFVVIGFVAERKNHM